CTSFSYVLLRLTQRHRQLSSAPRRSSGDIVVRTNPDGSQVRLKDVARIELGTQLYNAVGRHDGKPAAVIAVFQIPGTNALAGGQGDQGDAGGPVDAVPAGPGVQDLARHDAARRGGHQRDRPHARSRRSSSSSSWSSSSCRTGGRR
ncbi:MAG: efflux RND transporter permease subunit, partial [Bacillus subtilis]|nr:efflux RND transporter permease subunit [Bacillus subtilis]